MEHEITHRPEEKRFTVRELAHEAYLECYALPGDVLDYAHTYTPNEIRGRGIATAIIRRALEYARANGKTVIPGCPFVRTYVDRHHEFRDVLADSWRHGRDETG